MISRTHPLGDRILLTWFEKVGLCTPNGCYGTSPASLDHFSNHPADFMLGQGMGNVGVRTTEARVGTEAPMWKLVLH